MQKKFKITVDGRPYNVTVEDVSEDVGNLYPPQGMNLQAVEAASPSTPAVAAVPRTAAPAAGAGDEVSPLGGVIVSIDVSVGQQVKEGDKIATIEAMKMKTTVFAHRTGKVTNIAVKPGDGVEAGQVLLTIA